jgi:bifunctional ADP-heptose synthase (sugar kinase/adenylyltransferase)
MLGFDALATLPLATAQDLEGFVLTLAVTEDDDSLSSVAAVDIDAVFAVTEAGDTLSANVEINIAATVSLTEADDALTSAAALRIATTLTVTEDDDTLSTSGTLRAGSILQGIFTGGSRASVGAFGGKRGIGY